MESLSPWALRPTIKANVLRPASVVETPALLQKPRHGSLLPMGTLRSYGDACVNPGGEHLSTENLRDFSFDAQLGIAMCGPGVTLQQVMDKVVPLGWFLPVIPGTSLSSIGGAFACDVHGKSHHVQGSFSSSVIEIDLMTADRVTRVCSRSQNEALFWASVGGLGQTGLITRLSLQLRKVESAYFQVHHYQTRDLAHTFELCNSLEEEYSVCWVDSLARGKQLGRGILMTGHHATREEMATFAPQKDPFATPKRLELSLPFYPQSWMTGSPCWRMFNAAYYAVQRRSSAFLAHYRPYFCPLDGVAHWNRVYGRAGFLEYQFVVPPGPAEDVCRKVLEGLSANGNGSFLAVLKRMGRANAGHLSFPIEGYTLAVDMQAGGENQEAVLRRLDNLVAKAGGRIYLVKDSRLDSSFIQMMYPRQKEWAEIVNTFDPEGIFRPRLFGG